MRRLIRRWRDRRRNRRDLVGRIATGGGARIIPADEKPGTTAVCCVAGCDDAIRRVVSRSHELMAFGDVLVKRPVLVYALECGHAVAYYTGDARV